MKYRSTVRFTILVVTFMAVAAPPVFATSTDRSNLPGPFSLTVDAKGFKEARINSRRRPDTAEERSEKARFLRESAEDNRVHYLPEEVEVVHLDQRVTATLPTDAVVDSLIVRPESDASGESLVVSSSADPGAGVEPTAGPGAEWGPPYYGTYKLTVNGWGTANFTYWKWKFLNDAETTRDVWAYSRKAWATPKSIAGSPDSRVAKLYIRNYPTSATYANLVGWLSRDPGKSFSGDCNQSPFYAEVNWKALTVGTHFYDCDYYDVAPNENIPGEYRIMFDQGASITRTGTQEVAYTVEFSTKQNTVPYFHDHNLVRFYRLGNSSVCESINVSKTCLDFSPAWRRVLALRAGAGLILFLAGG